MSAHTGAIGVGTGPGKPRSIGWLTGLRERARDRRRQRSRRAHALRMSRAKLNHVPGSEHTHLLPRSRGF